MLLEDKAETSQNVLPRGRNKALSVWRYPRSEMSGMRINYIPLNP
jgi:hypothetical protein